uniref:Uncharacterized protein n=1 Tax=Lotharella globosa TaxID=91324 RepID=A0A7S4DN50_9EUKA
MCCCCCGSKVAHIATLLLLGFTYICIFVGFSGISESGSPYGTADVTLQSVSGLSSDQKQDMDFYLSEYTIQQNCGSTGQICPLNESATIKYKDSACSQEFCDKCASAGDGIITCLVLAFLVGFGGCYFVWKRLTDANSAEGEEPGCSRLRLYASCTLSIMALLLYIGFQIWFNPCQGKIDSYANALKDEWGQNPAVNATVSSGGSVASGFVLTALVVTIVAAGNQCCAVQTTRSAPPRTPGGVPPGGIALAQPVVPPPGGHHPAQAYPAQPSYVGQPYAAQAYAPQGQPVYAAEAVLVNNQMDAKGVDQDKGGDIGTV